MSRRASAKPSGIQMFPFMAVLICTMGALVVLLHAFARHGQEQAIQTAEAKARALAEDEENDIEYLQWRVGHLRDSRTKTESQLAEERLRLSSVEDHQRRLREKLNQLESAVAALERSGQEKTEAHDRAVAELADLKARLDAARLAVDKARREGRDKKVNYSIVPYHGKSGTHRRPIYIECRENLIVLQPEGIELTPGDFIGVFGPGNPLASALRAQREYLASQAPDGTLPDEPYPLLLVRPEGTEAYYAARAALDSWGSDFGYELVGSDWELKFPEPDERLAQLTRAVVDEARLRYREYVRSSPQMARRRAPRPVYHAKAHGGFAKEPGLDGALGEWSGASGRSSGGSRDGDWRGRGGLGDDRQGTGGAARGDGIARGGDAALGQPSGGGYGPADGLAGGSRYDSASGRLGDGNGEHGDAASGVQAGPYGHGQQADKLSDHDFWGAEGDPGGPRGDSTSLVSRYGEHGPPGDSGGTGGQSKSRGDDRRSGGSPNSPAGGAAEDHITENSGTGGQVAGADPRASMPHPGGANAPTGTSAQSPNAPQAPSATLHKPRSIASMRGENWALPEQGAAAVAASRPVLVECYPNRLVVVPEARDQAPKEIPLEAATRDSMEELVSAVWDHMRTWGKAGRGLYWRPMLVMDVKPGAAERYAEIKALLSDSGLDVDQRRKQAARRSAAPARGR